MKIYTKTGDDGTTALFGGQRIPKFSLRIESYGTVDELNACLGMLIQEVEDTSLHPFLRTIQSRLFDVGAHLAAVPNKTLKLPIIGDNLIEDLENEMDRMDQELPELRHFILPGSGEANARAHICRTVCRRAERLVVLLNREEGVEDVLIRYLNRLSDYFFMLSRYISFQRNEDEIKWIPQKKAFNADE